MKDVLRTASFRGVCILMLICLTLPAALFAQGAGFGSVSGVVQDATGAVVPGAHVVLDNPSKGIHRETDTTSSGNFDFPALVPASGYTVKITKTGFAGYEANKLIVAVGETVSLKPVLGVAAAATSVEVSAAAPTIDLTKTDVSTVVTSEQILDLPINGRRVDSFVLLSPGVTNDASFGLLSFRGNPGGNSFLTDGNDTTNSFYDENAGRTRAYNISQDAVQEFQVVSSNFLAEYGKASGGVVNTVTRSGGNSIHGSAYEFFRNKSLNAIDPTSNGVNPQDTRHQAGLSIGGPILKNKLFYFFNGELTRRENPIVSSNWNNNLYNATGGLKVTCDTATAITVTQKYANGTAAPNLTLPAPTAAQCASAIAYLNDRAKTQLIPRKSDANLLFGKIDYRPDDRNSFSFSSNYLDFRSPNGIQTQLSLADGSAIGNNADTNVFNRTGRHNETPVYFLKEISNEFLVHLKNLQYNSEP